MLTTNVQAQFIQRTIPSLPAIAGNVVSWICEFCDSQWPQSQKRCGSCKRWKGGKRSLSNKKDKQELTMSKDNEKKRGRKSKMLPTAPAQEVDIPLVVGCASCTSEVESKVILMGHPISCCHALVGRSFFIHCKVIISP